MKHQIFVLTAAAVGFAAVATLSQQAPAAGGRQTPAAAGAQTPASGGRQAGPPAAGRGQATPGSFERVPALPFPDKPQQLEMSGTQFRVVPFVAGLERPWALAFLPDGDILVTEKAGRLRLIRKGTLQPQPIAGVPVVWTTGQGGLLEVLPHPRFAENRLVYLTYSKPCEQGATTALFRGRFDGNALADGRDLFVADNCNTGNPHFGSKLAFGPDGMLYMTIGERGDRNRSQNTAIHGGKILRLKEDGTVPPDNPFVGKAGYKPEIFTYGHRNPQGLAFHPQTGALWENEHGPQGGDELNIIQAGKNYGWPVASYGREYAPGGAPISPHPSKEGIEDPVLVWLPSIGISGLVFYTGDKFPQWRGNMFAGGLSGLAVHRIGFNEKGGLLGREALLTESRQRIRDVRQGPDGYLYLAVDANAGGILRVEPAAAATSSPPAQANLQTDDAEPLKQAQALENDSKRKEALAAYRQILDTNPKHAGAHLGIGRVLDIEGQYGEARKHLQQAIDVSPERELNGALSTMAVSYAFEGKAADAVRFYQRVYDRQVQAAAPDSAGGTANAIGRVYLETGDVANAEKWYRTGYESASKGEKRTPEQTDLTEMRWHHAQARIAARRKQFDAARKHVGEVRTIVGRGRLDGNQQAQLPHVAGYVAFHEGNRDLAIAELSKADQDDPFILSLLAQAYGQKNDLAKARQLYSRILELPDHSLQAALARPLAARRVSTP